MKAPCTLVGLLALGCFACFAGQARATLASADRGLDAVGIKLSDGNDSRGLVALDSVAFDLPVDDLGQAPVASSFSAANVAPVTAISAPTGTAGSIQKISFGQRPPPPAVHSPAPVPAVLAVVGLAMVHRMRRRHQIAS